MLKTRDKTKERCIQSIDWFDFSDHSGDGPSLPQQRVSDSRAAVMAP